MRFITGAFPIATCVLLGLTACSPGPSACTEGYKPTFLLTVLSDSGPEPAIRFCDKEQCSPTPAPGPTPDLQLDRTQNAPALLEHLGAGSWRIAPRGTATGNAPPPSTARIELYQDGKRVSTTTIKLTWPTVDPCAATPEPLPSVIVTLP